MYNIEIGYNVHICYYVESFVVDKQDLGNNSALQLFLHQDVN